MRPEQGCAADDEAPPLPAGAMIGAGYRVLAHLRRGPDCDVYDAWSEERACRCVAKAPRPDRRDDRRARARLRGEGRLLLSLTHPHIIRAYALLPDPTPALILETVTGETLAHLLAGERRRLPLADLRCLGLHLCSALRYLHGRGVLHLDLKPSNVVCERGLAKLLDLGIARPPGPCPAGVGTPGYMAPEQEHGGELGEATDVWGLGLLLFEAARARRPAGGGGDPPPGRAPARDAGRAPAALASLIDGCLEARPADRPRVAEIAEALTRLEAATARPAMRRRANPAPGPPVGRR